MSNSEKPKSSWRERRQSIKHKWAVPFVYVELKCEQLSGLLERWAFLDILGHAGRLTILIAVIFYIGECDDRQKSRHHQAWQVIGAATGKSGNLGRVDALRVLVKDKVPLDGVDISKANLSFVNLSGANLWGVNLSEAILWGAKLHRANLWGADLYRAYLRFADLSGADLREANLSGADLMYAHLNGAYLVNADLSGAKLIGAGLSGADLANANLSGADLAKADLYGANLQTSNLSEIKNWRKISNIERANICDVNNPPIRFEEWAKEHDANSIKDESWERILLNKPPKIPSYLILETVEFTNENDANRIKDE